MRRRRGSSMIEFALGMLVLAPVMAGLARWTATSYLIYEMQEAVRSGAIYAAGQPGARYLSAERAGQGSDFERRVRNIVLCGDASGRGVVKIPGLKAENVNVTFGGPAGGIVTISIAGYEAPGGVVTVPKGPSASMPFGARGGT
jgi:hypothetical protein